MTGPVSARKESSERSKWRYLCHSCTGEWSLAQAFMLCSKNISLCNQYMQSYFSNSFESLCLSTVVRRKNNLLTLQNNGHLSQEGSSLTLSHTAVGPCITLGGSWENNLSITTACSAFHRHPVITYKRKQLTTYYRTMIIKYHIVNILLRILSENLIGWWWEITAHTGW